MYQQQTLAHLVVRTKRGGCCELCGYEHFFGSHYPTLVNCGWKCSRASRVTIREQLVGIDSTGLVSNEVDCLQRRDFPLGRRHNHNQKKTLVIHFIRKIRKNLSSFARLTNLNLTYSQHLGCFKCNYVN